MPLYVLFCELKGSQRQERISNNSFIKFDFGWDLDTAVCQNTVVLLFYVFFNLEPQLFRFIRLKIRYKSLHYHWSKFLSWQSMVVWSVDITLKVSIQFSKMEFYDHNFENIRWRKFIVHLDIPLNIVKHLETFKVVWLNRETSFVTKQTK